MIELKIEWLDECPKCECSTHKVETEYGSEKWLYDEDKVTCTECGQTGSIEADGESAWVNWHTEET